jgi:hypothetical protein
MSAHDAIAALPTAGGADHALIRSLLTKRVTYNFASSENVTTWTALDPDTGAIPLYVRIGNVTFQYDSTDSTTANDGITCLVTLDGKRYKSASITYPYAVLSGSVTTPPVSPTIGDAYLVATASTGTWSGKDGRVAVFTASGWQFIIYPIGKMLFVEDTTTYWHRDASGTWAVGVGSILFAGASITASNLIGKPVRWIAINQTTNAPPGSPTVGDTYIIGPSPTGAWSGNTTKIAVCESGTTFTIYTPRTGELAYDIASGNDYRFNGSGWVSGNGAFVAEDSIYTVGAGSVNPVSSGGYSYSGTPPTIGVTNLTDLVTLTKSAKRTGAKQRFRYSAQVLSAQANERMTVGLYRDSGASAVAWQSVFVGVPQEVNYTGTFILTAPDTSSHVYKVAVSAGIVGGVATTPLGISQRTFEYLESA